MTTRLVTIATFDEGAKARIAQNVLEAAGIKAAVADEGIVAMDWLLSNAVGGVKVQVREEDDERAVQELNATIGQDDDAPVDLDALTAEAEAESPDETAPPSSETGEADTAPESREETARRMVFTSLLSVFLPPVAFYSLYLFMVAFFGEGELSSRGRLNLWIGGAFTCIGLLLTLALLGVYL